jgi:hypothetical protein
MVFHVCQDEFGFWFVVAESDDGELRVLTHAAPLEDAAEDAEMHAARSGGSIVTEPEHTEFPPLGECPGYTPPQPRRANTG